MRLKKVFFSLLAGIEVLLLLLTVISMILAPIWEMKDSDYSKYFILVDYVSRITDIISSICFITIIDFILCIQSKKYNTSMFGIAITELVFVVFRGLSVLFSSYPNPFFYSGWPDEVLYCRALLYNVLFCLPFVGLAIAYLFVKKKFVKSTAQVSVS